MQSKHRILYARLMVAMIATLAASTAIGCGVAADKPPTSYTAPVQLQGQVLAGRNYMAYATVNIYATQPSGVATGGTYVGAAKLLTTVTTGPTGSWSISGLSCSSPDQLYVTASGGTPYPGAFNSTTLPSNPNSLMLTAVGDCSILGNANNPSNNTSIVTNEASTVAAVWALRPFISVNGTTVNITSDTTNYAGTGGVGTTTNFAGLAHGFLNANNLAPYKLGSFPQYTNGAVDATAGGLLPVQELNSLAYVQYLCTIGSDGTAAAGTFNLCQSLYALTTPPGGTAPSNSLQAMLNIANNPAYNATAILNFSLTPIPYSGQTTQQVINAGIFVPALSAFGTLTNDWSVAIYYGPGYGGTSTGQSSLVPEYVGIDANDDVFLSNPNASTGASQGNVIALTSNGQVLWTSDTDTKYLVQPRAIAPDQFGNVWVSDGGTTTGQNIVEQINAATGTTINRYTSTSTNLYGTAVDSLGNVWYGSDQTTGQTLHELVRSGTTYTEATFATSPSAPYGITYIRPDSKNNIWAAASDGTAGDAGAALYLPNTGTASAPTYTAGLQTAQIAGTGTQLYGIGVDAAGNAYAASSTVAPTAPATALPGELYKITVSGTGGSATLASSPAVAIPVSNPAANGSNARFMDMAGDGTLWFVDWQTGTWIYSYVPATGALTEFYPCYNAGTTGGTSSAGPPPVNNQTCTTGISTRYDLAIDSTGSLWVASYGNSGGGRIAQIIGIAAPTVPLRALGRLGQMP